MFKRFIIDGHMIYDTVEDKWFQSKDEAYVHMFNVLFEELNKK